MVRDRLGVDIGGTFTDFALVDDASGKLRVNKKRYRIGIGDGN